MIELIFAIVVVSISILALPTVLLTDATSQEQTLKEEGIMLTTTKVAQVLTYPWDQNSPPLGVMSSSQVLNTGGDTDLSRIGASDFREGHFPDELRRRMTPSSNPRAASAIGGAANSNIGAFDGEQVTVGAAGADLGYKKQYRLTTAVSYVTDAADYNTTGNTNILFDFDTNASAGTSNIKMVRVSTDELDTAGNWVPIIQMTSFASNIGEAEFFKRRY